jgi:hypothetical protein
VALHGRAPGGGRHHERDMPVPAGHQVVKKKARIADAAADEETMRPDTRYLGAELGCRDVGELKIPPVVYPPYIRSLLVPEPANRRCQSAGVSVPAIPVAVPAIASFVLHDQK